MLINEVEHLVGLSKKSIRFYEESGLLTPKRNSENDYRVYDLEDVDRLKKIKFLRELDVPVNEIKKIIHRELTLQACMKDRIFKVEQLEHNLQKVKEMCKEIADGNTTLEEMDMTSFCQDMNILNKEGFTMRKRNNNHMKKILGALLSSLIFLSLFLFLIGVITYFQMTEIDKMPWFLYSFLIIVMGFPIVGIVINFIKRVKEIRGGEEDEASKY